MALRSYCDACGQEMDGQTTIRGGVEINIRNPSDGSIRNRWEFCDKCLMTFKEWFRGFVKVGR